MESFITLTTKELGQGYLKPNQEQGQDEADEPRGADDCKGARIINTRDSVFLAAQCAYVPHKTSPSGAQEIGDSDLRTLLMDTAHIPVRNL